MKVIKSKGKRNKKRMKTVIFSDTNVMRTWSAYVHTCKSVLSETGKRKFKNRLFKRLRVAEAGKKRPVVDEDVFHQRVRTDQGTRWRGKQRKLEKRKS